MIKELHRVVTHLKKLYISLGFEFATFSAYEAFYFLPFLSLSLTPSVSFAETKLSAQTVS